jgi:hypothetical protein
MSRSKRASSPRFRVGRISVYQHHGTWWIYYRDGGQPVRRKVATTSSCRVSNTGRSTSWHEPVGGTIGRLPRPFPILEIPR